MKKILLYLLLACSISTFAQAEFPEGIQLGGNSSTANSTKLLNQNPTTGTLDHINATSLPVSTATANALDLKVENSSGAIEGFAITNNGDGTVNISTGWAYLRPLNDPYAPLIRYVIPAVTNLALTDNANNFVLVDYNGGSPALTVTIAPGTINTTTNSIAYLISRVGTTLDYINLVGQNVDANGKLRRRFLNSESLRRASGVVLTASNRNLLLTAGLFYSGLIEATTPAFNTSTGSSFTQAYLNGSTWVRTTGNTQINNTQYSLLGVLTTMPSNDYRVDYVYALADNPSKLYVLLGTTTYNNITNARLAPVPVDLPTELQYLGARVGRVIIQKDATATETTSEFATIYQAGTAQLHNDLGGLNLGDFQHLTVDEKAIIGLNTLNSSYNLNQTQQNKYRFYDAQKLMLNPPVLSNPVQDGTTTIPSAVLVNARVIGVPTALNPQFSYYDGDIRRADYVVSTDTYSGVFPDFEYVKNVAVTTTNSFGNLTVEFMFDGTAIELIEKGQGGRLKISIDEGKGYQTIGSLTIAGGASNGSKYLRKITFPGRALRKIKVQYEGVYFGGAYIGPNDNLSAVVRRVGKRAVFLGNSFTEGTGTNTVFNNYASICSQLLGWECWNSGSGGTGYIATGPAGRVKFQDRVTHDVISYNPDIVVIEGGTNDTTQDQSTLSTAVNLLISTVKTALPSAKIYVLSNFAMQGITTNITNTRNTIKTASASNGVYFIDSVSGITYNTTGALVTQETGSWITGTGSITNIQATGNASIYTATDLGHPSIEGHRYIGERLAGEIVKLNGIDAFNTTGSSTMEFPPILDSSLLHTIGNETKTGVLTLSPIVSASSLLARGLVVTPSLTSTANNDALVGLDISPTFANGAFTGVSNNLIRGAWNTSFFSINDLSPSNTALYAVAPASQTVSSYFIRSDASTSGNTAINTPSVSGFIDIRQGNAAKLRVMPTTGNVIIQNGGTFTDDNVNRLQVPTGTVSSGTPTLGNLQPTANNQLTRKDYVDTALALKANLVSPTFTGNPTAPTPTLGDNDTSVATTAFVQSEKNLIAHWTKTGDDIQNNNIGLVKIGTSPPNVYSAKLLIDGGVESNNRIYATGFQTGNGSGTFNGSFNGDLNFRSNVAGNSSANHFTFKTLNSNLSTAGTEILISTPTIFAPTSGTSVYNIFSINPTINQTGGANGITRALYINPTLTSAFDYRSIEVTAGKTILQETTVTTLKTTVYTVATLPASPSIGTYATVSDALAPTYMATVVGGGAVVTPVFFNGTNWVAH